MRGNQAISDLGVVAYAGMPIKMLNGEIIGSFCAIDSKPREWSERDLRMLSDMTEIMNAQLQLLDDNQSIFSVSVKVDRIESLCSRAFKLIHTILDQSRFAAGQLKFEMAPHARSDLIQHSVDSVLTLAQAKFIQIIRQGDASLMLDCDASRIEQVLSNILGNAVKFSPECSAITIQTIDAAASVVVSIIDQGPGIHEKDLPFIFDKFWQAERATRSGHGGGLRIARSVAEGHGGGVSVESKVGRGTRFQVQLPKKARAPSQ